MRKKMLEFCEKLDELLEWGGRKKNIVLLALSAASLVLSLCGVRFGKADPAWVSILLCGIPIVLEALIGLVTEFDIKADVLVAMALIASVIIREDFAAGEVAFIMQLGELLEDITVDRARAGIEKLVKLTPDTARRIGPDGGETVVDAAEVLTGDLLRVLPGETVPADGIIESGVTSVNEAVLTGESLPVDKTAGSEVAGGTVNQFGSFDMRATRDGTDSSIRRMIRLVESADAGKAKIVGIADRWATWIVAAAFTAAVLAWIITGEAIRGVTVLVVFCPCALVLATPTAIMAAIGNAAKHGFLVREGDALERLSGVSRAAFDKTGTLTHGVPAVTAAVPFDTDENTLLALTAQAEKRSEHPLGKAAVQYAESRGIAAAEPLSFEMTPGRGVTAGTESGTVLCGNPDLLRENGVTVSEAQEKQADGYLKTGCTLIWTAVNGRAAGFLALSDTLRETVPALMAEMKQLDVQPVLLTGDRAEAAGTVAKAAGISEYKAGCLPEEKLNWVTAAEESGTRVCMLGDGVNDAPALKAACVGIAMGGIGSDIAVEAADIALVSDDLRELPHLLRLSRYMMKKIKWNMAVSMAINFIAIVLAFTGVLTPVLGALVHNCGSVFVIANSALLLGWKQK